MQTSYRPQLAEGVEDRTGTVLSVASLLAWLAAMLLAIAGPVLGIQIPALVIVGMVAFSAAFSVLSLPGLLGSSNPKTGA